jgi:hypothetical protein
MRHALARMETVAQFRQHRSLGNPFDLCEQ